MVGADVYVVDVQYDGEYIDDAWCAYIQIFGRRSTGESVCVRVRGFRPYFYCLAPNTSLCSAEEAARSIVAPLNAVRDEHANNLRAKGGWSTKRGEQMAAISVSAEVVRRTPTMHYHDECDMLCIVCSHPNAVAPLRDAIVEDRVSWKARVRQTGDTVIMVPGQAFEANLEYVLRYMVDNDVCCNAWIRVEGAFEDSLGTTCTSPDLVCINPSQIIAYSDDEVKRLGLVSSLTLMSFDIECAAEKGLFPDPNVDPVIDIACDITRMDGRTTSEIEAGAKGVLFALGDTSRSVVGGDVDVRCFYDERQLLLAFAEFIRTEADPDVITSWNGPNFDWKYIVNRCAYLGCDVNGATKFSRIQWYKTRNRELTKSTKAFGTTKDNEVMMPGRVIFDLLTPVRKNYKERSYTLDAISKKFLGEHKDPIKHTEITELWRGTPEDRGKLSHYCLQDARLPRRILLKKQLWIQYAEMARVCRVPTAYLVTKGEQIKVFTQLCYKARQRGFAVDYIVPKKKDDDDKNTDDRDVGYQGATVIEPMRGFYGRPIATLDFTSLYPSIMMAHDLCYSTYVPKDRVKDFAEDDIEISPTGDAFVKPRVRKGLLPEVLQELGAARKAAKALMFAAEDAGDVSSKGVYDKRQLALKVSANSVYGFTGVKFGRLPLQPIARSVTAYGREMIEMTKAKVEESGPPGTEVIYGDTDSVMIKYPCSVAIGPDGKLEDVKAAIAESRAFALQGASAVNAIFPKPINLEYEKVFYPYLLISKKRYAGVLFEKAAAVGLYLATKGIESQRRDNAQMVPRILDDVLTCLMDDLSPERAIRTAVQAIRAVVDGPVTPEDIINKISDAAQMAAIAIGNSDCDIGMRVHERLTESYHLGMEKAQTPYTMKEEWCKVAVEAADGFKGAADAVTDTLRCNVTYEDHVMSKAYSRPLEKYDGVLPHTEVLKNMAKRGDNIATGYRKYLGDRINYIIIAPCPTRPETYDDYVRVDSKDLVKLKDCIPIGVETVLKPVDPSDPHGEYYESRRIIMGKKKKTQRTADRAEDPEWALAHEHVPDAVYYIEKQLANPIVRLLRALVGSKEAAVRRILDPVKFTVRPERGFYPSRLDADIKDVLGIQQKRKLTPTAQERKETKEWEKQHKGNPAPTKRPRKAGPLDAFFKVETAPASGD